MIASARELLEATPEEVEMSSERLQRLSRVIKGYVDSGRYPGAITMIARRGRVVHFETHGFADIEGKRRMEHDTIFRIYSMTKPIVSVGLMTLYEEGRFQLDDPVSSYLPIFDGARVLESGTAEQHTLRPARRAMTIRDLLTHTSGLVAAGVSTTVGQLYQKARIGGPRGLHSDETLADVMSRLAALPLNCDPGTRFNYGISKDVVGHLCEILSSQSLDVFLRERIFGPLGMTDTGFSVPTSSLNRFAACYRRRDGSVPMFELDDPPSKRSPYVGPRRYFSGVGGLVSTATDYMRFGKMLADRGELDGTRVLGPRTLELMTMNHLPGGLDLKAMGHGGDTIQPTTPEGAPRQVVDNTFAGVGFGLGFAVLLDGATAQQPGAAGEYWWGGAASTAFIVQPADDLVMLLMAQLLQYGEYPIRSELRATTYQAILD